MGCGASQDRSMAMEEMGEEGLRAAYDSVPDTAFTCHGRSEGYHADQEAGCQVRLAVCTQFALCGLDRALSSCY